MSEIKDTWKEDFSIYKKPHNPWNPATTCETCGITIGVLTTKTGKKLCSNCAALENADLESFITKKASLRKEVLILEKKVKDLKKTRDALLKEIQVMVTEISAKEAQEGAVEILEKMRDLTSNQ